MCPNCGAAIEPVSASLDQCSRRCGYFFHYPSAYPDDHEGNADRERPFDDKRKDRGE